MEKAELFTKNYILWLDYGSDGWQPRDCVTLEECVQEAVESSSYKYIITKKVNLILSED